MHEPNLSIVILEKITIHLQDFLIVQLLEVKAHLEHHTKTKVLRSQILQFILYHLTQLRFGQLFDCGF